MPERLTFLPLLEEEQGAIPPGYRRRQVLQALGLALLPAPLLADEAPLRFVFSRPRDNPRTQWLIRVYSTLLARLGRGFEFVDVPPNRATALVLAGQADGELGRTYGYQTLYPDLVRVEEPNNSVNFSVFSAQPEIRFTGWAAIRVQAYRCEYRRGIKELEYMLSALVGASHLSAVDQIAQGLRKLQLGRTDLYFDVQEAVLDFLVSPEAALRLDAGPAIRELAVVQATTGHAYLHQSYRALAPAMAAELKMMKAQGLVRQFLEEALAADRLRY